ncbi:MAG: hypothetical protein QW112_00385 [Candidatus Micrarchaeia archaeon]
MERYSARGGIYTFDLLLAVLIVLLIFHFGVMVVSAIADDILIKYKELRGDSKAFLLSEKIIRDMSSSKFRTSQNIVDSNKWTTLNVTEYTQNFKIGAMRLDSSFSEPIINGNLNTDTDIYCYTRLILLGSSRRPGIMRVCISDST